MTTASMTSVSAFLRLSRLEYLGAGIFFLFAVAAVGAGSWHRLYGELAWIVVGSLLWTFCHLVGSHVNCLADVEVDRQFKKALPEAVERLGRRTVIGLVVVESLGAAALAALFCLRTKALWPLLLFLVGWVIALSYSLEPVRLKRRGFLSPLSLLAVLYLLPIALGYLALAPTTSWPAIVFLAAVALQMFAVITLNSLEDIPEDRASGILTPFVKHGLRPVATVALVSYASGALFSIAALLCIVRPSLARVAVMAAMAAAHAWVLSSISRVRGAGRAKEIDLGFIRKAGRQNSQQFAVVGVAFAAAAILIVEGH